MLKKQYRLKNKKAFDATYRNKKVVSNSVMSLYIGKPKKDLNTTTKFGFVVSKKYHKRAVKRNRIKRLLRESVRLAIKENKIGNLDNYMSFIILPKINEENYKIKLAIVKDAFENLVKRVK